MLLTLYCSKYPAEKYQQLSKQTMKEMIYQVKMLINKMLNDISSIYRSKGVKFPVVQYYYVLIRMLAPIEVGSIINKHQVDCLFEKMPQFLKEPHEQHAFRTQKFRIKDHEQHTYDFNELGKKLKQKMFQKKQHFSKDKYIQIKDTKTSSHKKQRNDFLNQQLTNNDISPPKPRRGGHRIRSRGLEQQLCFWVIQQYEKGSSVSKMDIMTQARRLGRTKNFKGSARWCQTFLSRNQQIKKLIYLSKYNRKQNQKKQKQEQQNNVHSQKNKQNIILIAEQTPSSNKLKVQNIKKQNVEYEREAQNQKIVEQGKEKEESEQNSVYYFYKGYNGQLEGNYQDEILNSEEEHRQISNQKYKLENNVKLNKDQIYQ